MARNSGIIGLISSPLGRGIAIVTLLLASANRGSAEYLSIATDLVVAAG